MNSTIHPDFHVLLWNLSRQSASSDTLNIQLYFSDEESFDSQSDSDGYEWKLPSGLMPRADPGAANQLGSRRELVQPLDLSTAKIIGEKLWMSIPEGLRQRTLLSEPQSVWLKISGDVREAIYMPWECLPLPQGSLVSRSIPVLYPIPSLGVQLPLRVLFVASNPKDESLIRTPQELDALQMRNATSYTSEIVWDATLTGFRSALARFQPHIVHYVGHSGVSNGQGYLILHDESSSHTAWVGADQLTKLLPNSVRLLCLSTCFTGENYDIRGLPLLAQAPSDVRLPNTIVNRLPLDNSSEPVVRQFWEHFYSALSLRGDVASAFAKARTIISASRDYFSYSLVVRDGTGVSFAIDQTASVKSNLPDDADFDALYANSIANYLVQQASGSSGEIRRVLVEHSRKEAERGTVLGTGMTRRPEIL